MLWCGRGWMIGGEERGKSKFHTRVILLNQLLLHWLWLTPSEMISNNETNSSSPVYMAGISWHSNCVKVLSSFTELIEDTREMETSESDHSLCDVVPHWERSERWLPSSLGHAPLLPCLARQGSVLLEVSPAGISDQHLQTTLLVTDLIMLQHLDNHYSAVIRVISPYHKYHNDNDPDWSGLTHSDLLNIT